MDIKAYQRTYYKNNYAPGRARHDLRTKQRRKRGARLRQRILDLFGPFCVHCGFHDVRALQLDHVKSNPLSLCKYRSGRELYRKILNGELAKWHFQILCANCNVIKRMEAPEENSSPNR